MKGVFPSFLLGSLAWACVSLIPVGSTPDPQAHEFVFSFGTGVVVGPGKILTAKHVVQAMERDGQKVEYVAHPFLDLALVSAPTNGQPAAQVAPGSTKRGQKVSLVGVVMGRSYVHTTGHLAKGPYDGLVSHSCPTGPGCSGAGIYDEAGDLVGIHVGTAMIQGPIGFVRSPAEGLMIPVSAFRVWLASLL